ncbi:universal stress protein [Pseudonocardia lacus]|uniref:universal stress protein n=1 Tax=Pseudonocardia lacus TaxID=2835865 RepID=UPI001BDC89A8|nr:universal stress protein [Pseudonocardia lacus]
MTAFSDRPVVVGIDGSASALDAARWAALEARRRGAPLRLMTAYPWTRQFDGGVGLGESHRSDLQKRAERDLDAAREVVEAAFPGGRIDSEGVVGSPVDVLVEEAARAQLLVLGSRGRGGLTGLVLGSVAVALSVAAACPVVVVRGDTHEATGPAPVVVGVDDSPSSEAAIAFAFAAATSRGAPLVAVHTWLEHVYDAHVAAMIDWTALREQQRTKLAQRLAGWAEKHPEVSLTQVVERDSAAHTLVERSLDAQLVVVGSRGRGNLAGLVMGSVSHAVLQHAHCPVAVVRPEVG